MELKLWWKSTYLGHLVNAEQPGELQAQHLEVGQERQGVTAAASHQALSSDMAWDASGQPVPGCFPERGQCREIWSVSA